VFELEAAALYPVLAGSPEARTACSTGRFRLVLAGRAAQAPGASRHLRRCHTLDHCDIHIEIVGLISEPDIVEQMSTENGIANNGTGISCSP
jgi:hypothetical protein